MTSISREELERLLSYDLPAVSATTTSATSSPWAAWRGLWDTSATLIYSPTPGFTLRNGMSFDGTITFTPANDEDSAIPEEISEHCFDDVFDEGSK